MKGMKGLKGSVRVEMGGKGVKGRDGGNCGKVKKGGKIKKVGKVKKGGKVKKAGKVNKGGKVKKG